MSYKEWRTALAEYVKTKGTNREPHALLPLFDLVTSNLPADTSSKLLDDSNTQVLFREYRSDFTTNHQAEVTSKTVHAYLRFMVGIGFLKPPSLTRDDGSQRKPLQRITMGQEQKEAFEQVGRVGTRAKIQWRERAATVYLPEHLEIVQALQTFIASRCESQRGRGISSTGPKGSQP